jgi:hypothetical protein
MIMRDMRTTLTLDDDVLEHVREFAEGRKISLGRAASELIRRGVDRPVRTRVVNGLHVFDPPPGGPTITAERIRELEAEMDLEELSKCL